MLVLALLLIVAVSADTGPKPKILQFTLSPPGPMIPKDSTVVATARFQWNISGRPVTKWKIDITDNDYIREAMLRSIPGGNEYESKIELTFVRKTGNVSFEVSNVHGSDQKITHVVVTSQYKEVCDENVLCQPTTVCSPSWVGRHSCVCPDDLFYDWTTATCRKPSQYKEVCDENVPCQPTTVCSPSWVGQHRCYCPDDLFYDWTTATCRKRAKLAEACETSVQCTYNVRNSECNPEQKKCFCEPGYGIKYSSYDNRSNPTCNPSPIQMHKNVGFEEDVLLEDCVVQSSSLNKIQWVRNGRDICTNSSTWCSQFETETQADGDLHLSRMKLNGVMSSANYTCEGINNDGSKWVISEARVVVDYFLRSVKFETDVRLNCNVSMSNVSEVLWYRNGRDICKPGSNWCSQDSRGLLLRNVIRNDTYTCQAFYNEGRNFTVAETKIIVVPKAEFSTRRFSNSNDTVYCEVRTPNIDVRLVRDGDEFCTPEAKWCSKRNGIGGSYTFFEVLNLRANHTFTCVAYRDNQKLAIASIHHFQIGPKPEIHELNLSPPGPQPDGTVFVVTARFYSPQGEPSRIWRINGQKITVEEELMSLIKNEYICRVSIGPFNSSSLVSFEVRNDYGSETKKLEVDIARRGAITTAPPSRFTATFEPSTESLRTTRIFPTLRPFTDVPLSQGRNVFIKNSIFNIYLNSVKRQR